MVTSFACSDSRSLSASLVNSSVIALAGEARVGDHAAQRALELAHVGADALGDEERHFLRQLDADGLRLGHEDRHAGLELRRLDRHRESPAEARFEPLLQALDLLRVAVAGQDHLVLAFEQLVEGVEELLLRALLAGEELDVVDQQRISER